MGVNYSAPGPSNNPSLSYSLRPGINQLPDKDFYIEVYWNLENATIEEKQYLTSISLELYMEATSKENINIFLDEYVHNTKIQEQYLILARDSVSHQPKGMIFCILSKQYYLENDFSIENEYLIISGISSVKLDAMGSGIYNEMITIYIRLFYQRSNMRNYLYFDTALNPVTYLMTTKQSLVYPNSIIPIPVTIERFMKKLMKKYEFTSVGFDNPFVIVDMTKIETIDRQKWMKNYEKLPIEGKYFIDQTKLKEYVGLLFIAIGRLIKGNTLGLEPFDSPVNQNRLITVLVRDFHFARPLI